MAFDVTPSTCVNHAIRQLFLLHYNLHKVILYYMNDDINKECVENCIFKLRLQEARTTKQV
jgi:hypothetical protein